MRNLRINGRRICNGYGNFRLVCMGSESKSPPCPCLCYTVVSSRDHRDAFSFSLLQPCLQSPPQSWQTFVEWKTLWENSRLCRLTIYSGLRWFSWLLRFCNVTDHIPFGCLSHLLITYLMHTKCQNLCFDTLQESHNSLYQFKYWHLSFTIQFLYIWATVVLPTCCWIVRAPKAGQ